MQGPWFAPLRVFAVLYVDLFRGLPALLLVLLFGFGIPALNLPGLPSSGLKVIGRWHGMSGRGFAVVETNDHKALYAWVTEWSDLLPIETTPCLEDADAGAVLSSLKR